MAPGAEALTARGVAQLGWQRRAQLLAPPTLDSLELPGWLGARLDLDFQCPRCGRRAQEQPALAETGSLVTACPKLLIIRFGVGESLTNRPRLLGFASYFSLGNDEV